MGIKGPLVRADVEMIDNIALVAIVNRRARVLRFQIDGVDGAPVAVRVVGNDTFHGSFTVVSNLEIHYAGENGDRLYPSPATEVK